MIYCSSQVGFFSLRMLKQFLELLNLKVPINRNIIYNQSWEVLLYSENYNNNVIFKSNYNMNIMLDQLYLHKLCDISPVVIPSLCIFFYFLLFILLSAYPHFTHLSLTSLGKRIYNLMHSMIQVCPKTYF